MISEGSYDTEVMMLKILLFITGINILNYNNILQHYCFYCIFVDSFKNEIKLFNNAIVVVMAVILYILFDLFN